MDALLNNQYFVVSCMAVIVFLATQILKLPIKFCTKHIANERARKIANATILLIPFAVGVALEFFYTTYYTYTAFSVIIGLGYGTAGISLYATIERFFGVKVRNPYQTSEGEAVTTLIDNISADGKVDKKDKDAVKDFYRMLK